MSFIQGSSRILSRFLFSPDLAFGGAVAVGTVKPIVLNLVESVWLQLENLKLGDILSINTESSHYQFIIVGKRCGFLVSSNEGVPAGLYFIHGTCILNSNLGPDVGGTLDSVVYWGTLQVGGLALFANVDEPTSAFRTSKVVKLGLVRAGTFNSPYAVTTPLPSKPTISGSSGVRSKPPSAGLNLKPLGSSPVRVANTSLPKPVVPRFSPSPSPSPSVGVSFPQVRVLGPKVNQTPLSPSSLASPLRPVPKPSEFGKIKPLS